MKKIFNFIAAAAALVLTVSACSDVFAPAQSSTQPQVAGTVEIIISNVTDYSFDVTIAPKGSAAYYSYLVDNDEYYEGIDAASLYGVKYESIAQGNVKYGTGSESYSFTVETEPNTTYTVYAVAGSPEGNVGEVAYKTILTSDEGIPELAEYEFLENKVTLIFDEEVEAVEGKKILATAYAKRYLTGSPVIASTEGKILKNEDGVVIVQFEEIKVPGTFYIVSYEEGTFTDLVGNPCPALPAGSFTAELGAEDTNDDAAAAKGTLWAYLENVDFKFDTEDVPTSIKDYNAYVNFKSEQMLSKAFANKVTVSVVHNEAGKTTTTEYALSGAPTYGATSYYSLGVKLPEEPEHGDMITISIDKGAVVDIYGNENLAYETDPMVYSYGYTLADIVGSYTLNTVSLFGYGAYAEPLIIAESDDPEKGNIMFTGPLGETDVYYGAICKYYGTFDFDLGTITIPGGQVIGGYVKSGEQRFYALFLSDGNYYYDADLGFDVPAPHTLEWWYGDAYSMGIFWGKVANMSLAGWWDCLQVASVDYIPEGAGEPGEGGSSTIRSNKEENFKPFKLSTEKISR